MIGRPVAARKGALLDQAWQPFRIAWVLGELETPDVQELRAALISLAEHAPGHPLISLFDHKNNRYTPVARPHLEDHVARTVSELPTKLTVSPEMLAGTMLEPQPYPMRILISGEYIALSASHALGDARSLMWLLAELIIKRPPKLEEFVCRTSTVHLLNIALRQYLRRPSQLLRAVEDRPSGPPPTTEGNPFPPAPPLEKTAVQSSRIRRADLELLRRWRQDNCPSATMASLAFTIWFRALNRTGHVPEGFYLLVDARRYGGIQSEQLWGNYAKSVYVRPASVLSADDVSSALKQTISSTRPLATLTAQAFYQARPSNSKKLIQPSAAEVSYSLTYLGAPPSLTRLPWLGDRSQTRFITGATPADRLGVTVSFLELRAEMLVSVSLRQDNPDAARIATSLHAITEPCQLLTDSY